MTSKEKLELLLDCYVFKTTMDVVLENISRKCYNNVEEHWHRFERNSCSTYFYDVYNERYVVGAGFYTRYDNNDEQAILKYLENVVLISKNMNSEPIWFEPFFKSGDTIYHAISNQYYSEEVIQSAIQACCLNKELELGKITIKDKQYTIDEIEKLVEIAEQFGTWKK
jgi:hypothetical protein